MNPLHKAAREFAEKGIPVIPLHTPHEGKCSCHNPKCNSPGKHPRFHKKDLPNGLVNASSDLRQIDEWWTRWPDANIGLVTGARSGIVAIDIENDEGVGHAKNLLGSAWNKATVVRTGNGGFHLYFKHPGFTVANAVKIVPHVDIRGDGGYVVAPPSTHYSGNSYKWARDGVNGALPILPPIEGIEKPRLTTEDWDRPLTEGERNNELTRRAGTLARGNLGFKAMMIALRALNAVICDPPVENSELERIANSVIQREVNRRAHENHEKETAQATSEFSLLTLDEFAEKHGGFTAEWDIKDWLPKSTVGMIVAPPGTFKTWLLADLCTATVGARPFMGRYWVKEPGPVIFIQQEDYMPMLFSRISLMLCPGQPTETEDGCIEISLPQRGLPFYTHDQRQLHLSNSEIVGKLRDKIAQIRPRLVVLDPLYSAVDIKDYMAEAAQTMLVLKDLRDEFGCSFLIAHHTTKSASADRKRDELWGSQFLNAWLETGWQIRGDGSPKVEIYRHFKICPNIDPIQATFEIDEWNYSILLSAEPQFNETWAEGIYLRDILK